MEALEGGQEPRTGRETANLLSLYLTGMDPLNKIYTICLVFSITVF